jgi:hypothetical protein
MNHRLAPRLVSFALATLVTWSIYAGIDTLALEQHSGAMQMSMATGTIQVASVNAAAPRS